MSQDFKDILSIFIEHDVRFILVGAYALGAYVRPRATGDLDLWVEPSAKNADAVLRSIAAFGAPIHDLTQEDLQKPGTIFQIGIPPLRIDLLTSVTGVDFESAWNDRKIHSVLGLEIPILSKAHLVQNKRATGRPKDLLDLEELSRAP